MLKTFSASHFFHLYNRQTVKAPSDLSDAEAELAFDGAENLLDRLICLLIAEGMVGGAQRNAERKALLAYAELFSAVNVEQVDAFDKALRPRVR